MNVSRLLCMAMAVLATIASAPATAQTMGSLRGTLSDEAGSSIPGATITLTGPFLAPHTTVSQADGSYVFPNLPPGEYTIRVELAGFATIESPVEVRSGASATMDLTLDAGGPADVITVTSDREISRASRPSWNTWFSPRGLEEPEPVAELRAGRTYDFFLDLSRRPWQGAGVATGEVGEDLMEELLRAYGEGELILSLSVRPILLGEALKLVDDTAQTWSAGAWRPVFGRDGVGLEVRLGNLLDPMPPQPASNESWQELTDRERAGGVRFVMQATRKGCSTLVLSILDAKSRVPLDALVREVAVAGADCGPEAASHELTAGLVSLLRGYAGELDVAGALQLVETQGSQGRSGSTVAIYVPQQPMGDCPVFSWQLDTTLSYRLFKSTLFATLLAEARKKNGAYGYPDVAAHLRGALFPRSRRAAESCGSARALEALRSLTSMAKPRLYFTLVTDQEPLFAPLGLLFSLEEEIDRARRPYFSAAPQLFQPLPSGRPGAPVDCIRNWTFFLPEKIDIDGRSTLVALSPRLTNHAHTRRSMDDLRQLIESAVADPASLGEDPIGIVLLAHHAEGDVYFDDLGDALQAGELKDAKFPVGSVALLVTCSTGNLVHNLDFVWALSEAGFDTILLSPFPVDVTFGTELAQRFAEAVADAAEKDGPTIHSLFSTALSTAAGEVGSPGMALEFLVAGSPGTRVCRPE